MAVPQFDKLYYAIASESTIFNHGDVIFYDGEPDDENLKGLHWFKDTRGKFQLLNAGEFTDDINDIKK